MKKILIIFILAGISVYANAQTHVVIRPVRRVVVTPVPVIVAPVVVAPVRTVVVRPAVTVVRPVVRRRVVVVHH